MSIHKTRLRFSFWLDIIRDDEFAVAEQIQILKRQRAFVKTVRDGIRLICDLRAGQVDVLFELFPLLKAEFIAGVMPKPDNDPSGSDKVQRQLDELKELMLRSTTPPLVAVPAGAPRPLMAMGAGTGMPQALNVPKFDLPRFEDEDDAETLILTKDTRTDSAANFLNSMLALQQ